MTIVETIWLPAVPPSMNAVVGRGSHWRFTKAKKRWEIDLGVLLMASPLPRGLELVEATALLTFPTRRRRDEGNFRTVLEKALGDALQSGGWIPDDTPEHYRFGAVSFALGDPRTEITLTCKRGHE